MILINCDILIMREYMILINVRYCLYKNLLYTLINYLVNSNKTIIFYILVSSYLVLFFYFILYSSYSKISVEHIPQHL